MSATEDPKATEYYAATVNAWYATRLERDKSLLTLDAAGIGVLVALMSGIHSVEGFVVFILALVAFAISLGTVLWIFHRNSIYLQRILSSPTTGTDPLLTVLDGVAVGSFISGVVLTAALGIAAAARSLETQEPMMTMEKIPQRSFNTVGNMRPAAPREVLEKSFNGAANLRPAQVQSSTPSSPASSTPPTQPAPAQPPSAKPK